MDVDAATGKLTNAMLTLTNGHIQRTTSTKNGTPLHFSLPNERLKRKYITSNQSWLTTTTTNAPYQWGGPRVLPLITTLFELNVGFANAKCTGTQCHGTWQLVDLKAFKILNVKLGGALCHGKVGIRQLRRRNLSLWEGLFASDHVGSITRGSYVILGNSLRA